MSALVPYEDHVPDTGNGDFELAEPECFVCGREWPCPKTIAYNDGLNDGAVQEGARLRKQLDEAHRTIALMSGGAS